MKKIVVSGSTGSIGRQTLDVVRSFPEKYEIIALCAGKNAQAAAEQAREFRPQYVAMTDGAAADELRALGVEAKLILGPDASAEAAALPDADIVVNGISGFAGMRPLLSALRAGKRVALANKESIVCAHELVYEALERGGEITPVDSEQSAIFQCLAAGKAAEVQRLVLTASGGPFRTYSKERLASVTPEEAGRHPTWSMGRKITIDSASLFNKGLEIIEAAYLFRVSGNKIAVLIHPESIVHSMVEFADGSNVAQLSRPDMRLAIQYALNYPERAAGEFGRLRLEEVGKLTFYPPDVEKFPAIPLAYAALAEGKGQTVVYNGANEAAVELFMKGRIRFTDIPKAVEYALTRAPRGRIACEEDVIKLDAAARRLAAEGIGC